MSEKLGFSFALDLMFNGQDMDYCDRPISLTPLGQMSFFFEMPERAHVAVIGPGGGRLIKTLLKRGYTVDGYEGRAECLHHLEMVFSQTERVRLFNPQRLEDPIRAEKLSYDAIFCMDDLRSFREQKEWTSYVQKMIREDGYFVYSQVSNKLPKQKNNLSTYFDLVVSQNVSKETAEEIRNSYFGVEQWRPDPDALSMAKHTLDMVESGARLRRSIRDGVEIKYVVWKKKPESKGAAD